MATSIDYQPDKTNQLMADPTIDTTLCMTCLHSLWSDLFTVHVISLENCASVSKDVRRGNNNSPKRRPIDGSDVREILDVHMVTRERREPNDHPLIYQYIFHHPPLGSHHGKDGDIFACPLPADSAYSLIITSVFLPLVG